MPTGILYTGMDSTGIYPAPASCESQAGLRPPDLISLFPSLFPVPGWAIDGPSCSRACSHACHALRGTWGDPVTWPTPSTLPYNVSTKTVVSLVAQFLACSRPRQRHIRDLITSFHRPHTTDENVAVEACILVRAFIQWLSLLVLQLGCDSLLCDPSLPYHQGGQPCVFAPWTSWASRM